MPCAFFCGFHPKVSTDWSRSRCFTYQIKLISRTSALFPTIKGQPSWEDRPSLVEARLGGGPCARACRDNGLHSLPVPPVPPRDLRQQGEYEQCCRQARSGPDRRERGGE